MKGKVLESLQITDIADGGKSVARYNGIVIFVDKALPGDIVDVLITRKHSSYLEGRAIKRHSDSEHRTAPFCKHFGICGGCKWQDMTYSAQLYYKSKQVFDSMQRIGKVEIEKILPIIPSNVTKYYRNKLDYSFADRKWLTDIQMENFDKMGPGLGYHVQGKFDRVIDIEECYLQPDPSDAIRNAVKNYSISNNLSFINLRHRSGLLRSLIIRNTTTSEWMVIVMVYDNNEQQLNGLLEHLAASFSQIKSLLYIINPKANDSYHDLEVRLFKGDNFITEELNGLKFRINAKSFFQTNPIQTKKLYEVTADFAGLTGEETVYDLYTGTGTIANYVASESKKVIGIEYVADAIEDAKINSQINNIYNTFFIAGDMRLLLNESLFSLHGRPDVIITDPPRAGMHADVVDAIRKSGAKKIVYVSCNPSTQARDINLLSTEYKVEKMQPVDMFPHTAHVENIALLVLR
jgi:23S rRNA (uracil1939-C5)-methyltransferase